MSDPVYGEAALAPVTLAVPLRHLDHDYAPGDVILVPDDIAEAFRAAGICPPASPKGE